MLKPKTHFEQVPLEAVRKIVEQAAGEITTEEIQAIRKKKLEGDFLALRVQSTASSRTDSQVE